jgi:hypothetical protein
MRFTYAPGDRPLDGFTIRRAIGRGGFGEVYQAVSEGGKIVALKHVQRHLDVELRGVGQCLNVKSPHLVEIIDIKQTPGEDYWIVMEYMDGDSLDRVISRCPQGMPEDLLITWLIGLCEGVRSLHERGIVHRDLKPGNVFMGQGVVKLGDYGLSKFISASRRSGHTGSIGTVHYMAPEVAQGRYGKEIDLYSIGVMLYEMLTGKLPFDGETAGEILMKHLTTAPDLRMLPSPYREVVGRLLEKDPERRYPTVDAALADLGITRDSVLMLHSNAMPHGVPVLQPIEPIEPTDDYREGILPPVVPSARPRNWVLVVSALVVALFMAGWFAFIGEEVLRLDEATPAFAIGVGILSFLAVFGLLRLILQRQGLVFHRLASRRSWIGSLPWYGRLALALAGSIGTALILGAFLAETRSPFRPLVAISFVVGCLVFAGSLMFFFGRPADAVPRQRWQLPRRHRPSPFGLFLRIMALGLGVGLLVGGFLGGMMNRESEVGVMVGIGCGLFTCVVAGIYWQARLFTGLTVAALTSLSLALFVGAVFATLFRHEEPAVMAAIGIGLITFTVVMVLWQRFLQLHVDSARVRAQSFIGRILGSELERVRG